MNDFTLKAKNYWTADKFKKAFAGKNFIITPANAPLLLRHLGLLNGDASMSPDGMKKFIQINHMVKIMEPSLKELSTRFKTVNILDCGCGSSFLTFLLAWTFTHIWKHPVKILGIDSNEKLIEKCKQTADLLQLSEVLEFKHTSVQSYIETITETEIDKKDRYHAVVALHACDTATDDALQLAIKINADFVAVAPCCQAELASQWKKLSTEKFKNALSVIINSPELRRDSGASFTDALRVLVLRACGYETTTTEFVPSTHTPKNRLILAERRGLYLKEAFAEYDALKESLGGIVISLEKTLQERRDLASK